MAASDATTLQDMGFDQARIAWALRATKNAGLQPAMDHILANLEKDVPAPGNDDHVQIEEPADGAEGGDAEAKSIKCSECGKVFRNSALAQYHAEKSGHAEFEESTEEIKPLTEEEKKAKLEELRSKMAEKRATKSKAEQEEAKANELIRRKAGRDIEQAREDLKKKELTKEAEEKKREKKMEAEARARVKAQIESDKRERAERAAREKQLRESGGSIEATPAAAVASPVAALRAGAGAGGSEARLRVRAPGGVMWMGSLPAGAKLREVLGKMEADGKLSGAPAGVGSVRLSNTFPRKQYTDADLDKTLAELGLVPNAGLEAAW
ncbi:unnamed protein product [Tilletia controversa]|uniref:C2H2-type domain-containing protein n=1 Tax=Tilletia caries TaxID=13290 RepID=A0ABN7IYU4_9BASI|nr:hypothetical protein CF336_g2107 [Tilletia laevis]KAE8199817.1 hypothetical protein CF328_g3138 [Tilletia controversa]CAD6928344.1 unnamed protein product [Tilletia caries]CAD6933335.1 unnamed protein product [Tilletia caries]CAD6972064.1 unnamed protein product [Tilletia controversa]